jgi:hypothetical protein
MANKDRAVYSKRVTPGRSSSSQDTSISDYGRVIHSNFHFAEGPSALYSGRRSALEDLNPVNKPLVSLDVNIDVSCCFIFMGDDSNTVKIKTIDPFPVKLYFMNARWKQKVECSAFVVDPILPLMITTAEHFFFKNEMGRPEDVFSFRIVVASCDDDNVIF